MSNIQRYSRKEAMFSLILQWQNSSTRKKEFCVRSQVGIHTFNYWLKRFNKENRNTAQGFTEYKIVDKQGPSTIRINFPNGITAELPQNIEYELVQTLINNWQPCLP